MLLTGFVVVAPLAEEPLFYSYAQRPDIAQRLLSRSQVLARGTLTHEPRSNPVRVLMLGQLHYREQLVKRLGTCRPALREHHAACDASLVATLVSRFGAEVLRELEGDFSLVCYEALARRLTCLRDPLGGYPLFWTKRGGNLAVGTSIRALLPFSPSCEVDPEYVSAFLAFPTDAISELPSSRTACRSVERVLPGYQLELDLARRTETVRRCFHWEVPSAPPTCDIEQAGLLVRTHLNAAVGERLSRTADTASHFSGGLDSTGIGVLADRLAARSGASVHALSLVYRHEPSLLVEHQYIHCALEENPRIVPHLIEADELLDFGNVNGLPLLDEPAPAIARFELMQALVDVAKQAGADSVLSGDGADHLFARDAGALIEQRLARGHVAEAWGLVQRVSYAKSKSVLQIASEVLASAISRRLAKLRAPRARRVPFEHMKGSDLPAWLDPQQVRRHVADRSLSDARWLEGGDLTVHAVAAAAGNWFNWHIGMPSGVLIHRPYWDCRLVKLGLALPQEVHVLPGNMKPVLHAALCDVLPKMLLARRRKSHFGVLNRGFARHRQRLLRLIDEAPLPPSLLDRAELRDAVHKTSLGVYTEARSVGRLRLALSYLSWISDRDLWLNRPFPVALAREFEERPVESGRSTIAGDDSC